jgi:hypothetical protein
MNVRLQYDLEFLGGVYYNDLLQLNNYRVSLSLTTQTNNPADTNIAMDRLKCFVLGELENTVFINQNQLDRAELMSMMGINITTLPEEPVDQIIGIMLFQKLNAIMEGRMVIDSLDISSSMGDSVWYQHDAEDALGPFAQSGWWDDSGPVHSSLTATGEDSNVVKLTDNHWRDYQLDWPDTTASENGNTVVFANFPKNEN